MASVSFRVLIRVRLAFDSLREIRPSDYITIEGSVVVQTEKPLRLIGLASAECPFCHGTYVEVDESHLTELLIRHYALHEDWKIRPSDTITTERKE